MKNYKKANRITYKVGDISLHRWCEENGLPYSAAYSMLRCGGLSIEEMKTKLKENYYSEKELAGSMKSTAYHYAQIYPTASREKRLEIREEFTKVYSRRYGFESLWEKIVAGKFKDIDDVEVWKSVKGDPTLEVSNLGNFRRKYGNGACRKIKTFFQSRSKTYFLAVKTRNKNHAVKAAVVVAEAFVPKPSKNHVINLIDGDYKNIKASNIRWVTMSMHGMLTGYSIKSSKPVELLDDDLNVIEVFESVRQAAKELGLSYTTISDYCKDRIKKPLFDLRFAKNPDYSELRL